MKSEHPPEADGHVRVAGEIEVDLQRVADHREPRVRGIELAGRRAEDLVGRDRNDVRNEDFLAKPRDEATHALGEVVERDDAARQLVGDRDGTE